MSYSSAESFMVENLYNVDDTQKYPIGQIIRGIDPVLGGGEFIYLKGITGTVLGSFVTYDYKGTTVLTVADCVGPVATALAATISNKYGWYQISGKAVGYVLTGYADGGIVNATSTPGAIDDPAATTDNIVNAKGAGAIGTPSATTAYISLSRPFANNVA